MQRLTLFASTIALAYSCTTASALTFPVQPDQVVSDGVPSAGAGRIDVNTEQDFYTFPGTNGQALFIEELGVSSSFSGWLRWEMKAPNGASVFSAYMNNENEGRVSLTQDGTYTIRVWVGSANPDHVGTYSFRLRSIPADDSFPIQFDDLISNGLPGPGAGNLENPGSWDVYTFNASAGQLAFFETIAADPAFKGNLYCDVRTPSSNSLFSAYLTAANHPGRKTLPETGAYKVRVYTRGYDIGYTGSYSIRIRSIPPDQFFGLQPGDTVAQNVPAPGAGSIDAPGAQDFYTFNGTAGQSLSFETISESPAFGGWLQWEAKTPTGQTLFSSYFDDAGRKTLPETGAYTIRVWVGANNTTSVGTYSFRIHTLPGDVRLNIAKGETISDGVPIVGAGRIDQPGGLDTYTFDGLEGQRVCFEQISADAAFAGYLFWQVITPAGSNLFTGYFPGGTVVQRRLPDTGPYTVRIFAESTAPSFIGPYSFRTWCPVKANPDNLATLPGAALSVPAGKLLCNDSVEIGDSAVIELASSASSAGGSLAVTNGALAYVPAPGFTGFDTFSYRLAGQFGGEDTTTVTVRVGENVDRGATVVSLVRENPNTAMVCLLGAPNASYIVEQSADLAAWTGTDSLTADEAGSMTYYYTIEPAGNRFYRFRRL